MGQIWILFHLKIIILRFYNTPSLEFLVQRFAAMANEKQEKANQLQMEADTCQKCVQLLQAA